MNVARTFVGGAGITTSANTFVGTANSNTPNDVCLHYFYWFGSVIFLWQGMFWIGRD